MPERPINPWHGTKPASAAKQSATNPANSRWMALQALQAFTQQGVFVAKTLEELFQRQRMDPRERRLATELASETIRRGISLDAILSQYVVRPRESVEDDLWLLLQLGACQLLCLQHIPAHAAVHETVALCENLDKPRAKGIINGTLRSIEREIMRESSEDPQVQTLLNAESLQIDQLNSHQWPILVPRDGVHSLIIVELARSLFACPVKQPLDYISQVTGLPQWLIARWETQFSDLNKILKLGLWFTTPGRLSLRVNRMQSTRESVLSDLQNVDVSAQPGTLPEAIVLRGSTAVVDLPGFATGAFSVQDESAMAATELLNPQPGESILDLCAAPGGKTCHIAERLQGTGRIIACDTSADRLKTVSHNTSRLHLENVSAYPLSADGNGVPAGPYDAVLVDVPCSNTGVLGKRPEARWRLTPVSFEELIPLQKKLLNLALEHVRSGGRVVYSTCSIDQAENEDIVDAVLSERSDVRLVSQKLHWPGAPADGGYQALLVKN